MDTKKTLILDKKITRLINFETLKKSGEKKDPVALAATNIAAAGADRVIAGSGRFVKLFGKIRQKQKTSAAVFVVLSLIIGFFIIAAPYFGAILPIHMKEVMTDKYNDMVAAVESRSTLIIKKRVQGATTGCNSAIPVSCRFSGLSDTQIKNFKKAGITVNYEKRPFPIKNKVTSFTMRDGRTITADQFANAYDTDSTVRSDFRRAFNPKFVQFDTNPFKLKSRTVGITKQKNITGTTEEELRKSHRNVISGEVADSSRTFRTQVIDGQEVVVDENGNIVKNADGSNVDPNKINDLRSGTEALDRQKASIAETGRKLGVTAARSAAFTAITAGVGATDAVCTGYRLMQIVGYGAKILGAQQLIRFVWMIYNEGDAAKADDSSPETIEYASNIMADLDEFGKSATDSYGYKYAAYGDLALPSDKDEQASIFQFSLGAGFGSMLIDFTNWLNDKTGGAPETTCGVIKNPWVQGGLIVGGIALAIFTAGGSIGVGAAVAAVVTVSLAALFTYAEPILINLAAGQLVDEFTVGGEAGNAITAGAGALNATNAQAHGLSPLTQDNVLAATRESDAIIAQINKDERNAADPLDFSNPQSSISRFAMSVAPVLFQKPSLASVVNTPKNSLSQIASIAMPRTSAANELAQYQVCTDRDYTKLGLAVDPFCNARFSLVGEGLDPQVVLEFMLEGKHVDANGAALSAEYNTFLKNCVNRSQPYGYPVEEEGITDGSECIKGNENYNPNYDYFGTYGFDGAMTGVMDGENVIESAAPNTSTGANGLVQGTDQDLARQILASGNVTGDSRYMGQIKAYAEGDYSCNINPLILSLIATIGQTYEVSVSSLNRRCTGVITDSGERSRHRLGEGGHAVDFNYVNGVHSTGGTSNDLALLNDILPLMPSGSRVGQQQCRPSGSLTIPSGMIEFNDSCNHIHLDVDPDISGGAQ